MVTRQRIRAGRAHAGKTVTVILEDTRLRVLHNGEELSLRPRTTTGPRQPLPRLRTTQIKLIMSRMSREQPVQHVLRSHTTLTAACARVTIRHAWERASMVNYFWKVAVTYRYDRAAERDTRVTGGRP